jgi:hypothetical protein
MSLVRKTRLIDCGYKLLLVALLGLWVAYPPQQTVQTGVEPTSKALKVQP